MREPELGLYSVRARWLDPARGQWLSVDPAPSEPRYAYAGNVPTVYTDPSGALPSKEQIAEDVFVRLGMQRPQAQALVRQLGAQLKTLSPQFLWDLWGKAKALYRTVSQNYRAFRQWLPPLLRNLLPERLGDVAGRGPPGGAVHEQSEGVGQQCDCKRTAEDRFGAPKWHWQRTDWDGGSQGGSR